MQVADRVRVTKLERQTEVNRDGYVGQGGKLVQRLNVPWTPEIGANWIVGFDDGSTAVFSANELTPLDDAGGDLPSEMADLKKAWGDAPRTGSQPATRMSTQSRGAIAALILVLAGLLLIGAGIAGSSAAIGVGGAAVALIGVIAAVVVMVS